MTNRFRWGILGAGTIAQKFCTGVQTLHKDHALLALRAGKHVLCEKPFTINAAEAKVLIDEARTRQRFLMEAMWNKLTKLQASICATCDTLCP